MGRREAKERERANGKGKGGVCQVDGDDEGAWSWEQPEGEEPAEVNATGTWGKTPSKTTRTLGQFMPEVFLTDKSQQAELRSVCIVKGCGTFA